MNRRLGVDCWDVIFPSRSLIPRYKAIESLNRLVHSGIFGSVFVVSQASWIGERIELGTLRLNSFCRRTEISRGNVKICRRHEQKRDLCAELGITDFVDDRLDVLCSLDSVARRYRMGARSRDTTSEIDTKENIVFVNSWLELLRELKA